ncbi:TAXI family TRAP transporter solute-binding subunit [Streptomyces sp. UH6]|uniref:TAXI family TRAP transporter solute-binding subunit n=1 Tax=Streptomyces sp. UH6 TaxID=2748379 RepID=UPI0015D49251|nr:TAXI family TRAP transporter solute-binding subunit [Streptomyces sp. UH6]NYV75384.1 TAXI family TRAP transporter solute-binding subunit [Streptomyces sp. UH6]
MFPAVTRIGRRRALTGSFVVLVVLAVLLWWLLPLGRTPPSGRTVFGTGTPAGVYHVYGEELRKDLAVDMPDLSVRLKESSGSRQNVAMVAVGKADFAIAAADAVQEYKSNESARADQLRGVARLYDDYLHVLVPADSDVRHVADLKGLRVGIGPNDSGVQLIAERVLTAAGLDPQDDIVRHLDGIDTGPDKLRRGEIDALFWSGGIPTAGLTNLARTFDYRFVPVDSALVTRLHEQGNRYGHYRSTTMPESAYPEAMDGEPVETLAVSNLLITRADADPELTEWLTRTVIRSRDEIGEKVHSAQLVDVRTAIDTHPVPLHEGARDYYRSVKP